MTRAQHPPGVAERRIDASAWSMSLAALAVTAAMWPTPRSFHAIWTRVTYSHGYLLAIIVGFLLWRDRGRLVPGERPWTPAMVVLPVASGLWALGVILNAQVVHVVAFPVVLASWLALISGRKSLPPLIWALAMLALALPVWQVITPALLQLTIAVSGSLVRLAGIPAEINANLILIPAGSFLVEDGCAGLAYFLAGLVLGTGYARMNTTRWSLRLGIIAAAAAAAALGNWLRVAALIVIGHASSMQSGIVYDHATFGWLVFVLVMVPFFWWARRITRREPVPALTPSPSGEARHGWRLSQTQGRVVLAATLLALVGPGLYHLVGRLPESPTPDPLAAFGNPGWTPVTISTGDSTVWTPAYHGYTEHVRAGWARRADTVIAQRLTYRNQGQNRELVGYGNQLAADWQIIAENGTADCGGRCGDLLETVIYTGVRYILVWSGFEVGDRTTPFSARAKTLELRAFFRRQRESHLVALSTPCGPTDCDQARGTLRDLVAPSP